MSYGSWSHSPGCQDSPTAEGHVGAVCQFGSAIRLVAPADSGIIPRIIFGGAGVSGMRGSSAGKLVLALWLTAAGGGCESPGIDPLDEWMAGGRLEDERVAADHRQRFQDDGDPESLRWLLKHRLTTGMSLAEVSQELGQQGERLHESGHLKRGDGRYLESDVFYKWGPASDGQSVYLAFRDERLLHFDPAALE